MSDAIGPGAWLECIRDYSCPDSRVKKGFLYCVEGLDEYAGDCIYCGDSGPGLLLKEVHSDGWAWCHCTFRPMRRNPDLIRTLMEPLPDCVEQA